MITLYLKKKHDKKWNQIYLDEWIETKPYATTKIKNKLRHVEEFQVERLSVVGWKRGELNLCNIVCDSREG